MTESRLTRAVSRSLAALADDGPWPISTRLATYYDRDGNYAGTTFADLQPAAPRDVTATDLHAVSMLAVPVEPRATRRLLGDGAFRTDVLEQLGRLEDLGVHELTQADDAVLLAMEALFQAVRRACQDTAPGRPEPWVTVSAICARKRPGLFPVRDNTVSAALGLTGPGLPRGSYQLDWQLYRHLLEHQGVRDGLWRARIRVSDLGDAHTADVHDLRLLDAILWTYEHWRARGDRRARFRQETGPGE